MHYSSTPETIALVRTLAGGDGRLTCTKPTVAPYIEAAIYLDLIKLERRHEDGRPVFCITTEGMRFADRAWRADRDLPSRAMIPSPPDHPAKRLNRGRRPKLRRSICCGARGQGRRI